MSASAPVTTRSRPDIKSILQVLTGVTGSPPSEVQAGVLAEQLYVQLSRRARGSTAGVYRRDIYNYFVLHLGVTHVDHVDAIMACMPEGALDLINKKGFCEAIQRYCRRHHHGHVEHQQKQKVCAVADLLRAARFKKAALPKVQVLRGSDRLNKLSNTNAFSTAIVDRLTAKSMHDVYCMMQGTNTGGVDLPHFQVYLNRHNPFLARMARGIFDTLDKDRVGRLTFPRLLKLFYPATPDSDLADICRMAGYTEKEEATIITAEDMESLLMEVQTVFQVFAGRGGSRLDQDELVEALKLAGFNEIEALEMFPLIDKDGSGTISFDEFRSWYIADAATREQLAQERAMAAKRLQQKRRLSAAGRRRSTGAGSSAVPSRAPSSGGALTHAGSFRTRT